MNMYVSGSKSGFSTGETFTFHADVARWRRQDQLIQLFLTEHLLMGLIIKTEVPEMEMKKTCDVCGKEAIGMQIMGCCSSILCEEHADVHLKELKPGEKKEWGVCYFYRF